MSFNALYLRAAHNHSLFIIFILLHYKSFFQPFAFQAEECWSNRSLDNMWSQSLLWQLGDKDMKLLYAQAIGTWRETERFPSLFFPKRIQHVTCTVTVWWTDDWSSCQEWQLYSDFRNKLRTYPNQQWGMGQKWAEKCQNISCKLYLNLFFAESFQLFLVTFFCLFYL